MTRGKFIALEGGEGMGKSTQARILTEKLHERGVETVLTREPGGTAGAEAIRNMLLHPPGTGWGPRAEAMLFAAARSDHVENLIEPALKAGTWVVCDRFVDSSRAYQGAAGALGDETIMQLHELGSGGLRPDLTVVIAAGNADVAERLAARDGNSSDAIGSRDSGYHRRVNRAFLDLAESDAGHFAVIDGDGTIEEVAMRVSAAITPLLEG